MTIFPTKILLATDGSTEAELAAETASALAKRTGSELHVLHVLALPIDTQDPSSFEPEVRRQMEERSRATLEELVGGIESSGGKVSGSHLGVGRPDAQIVEKGEEIGTGLIVMGSRGYGPIRQALIGSVSDSVVRHAHCPVMVVRGEPLAFPTNILLATDGSEQADIATATVVDVAQRTDSELHVVHVGEVRPVYHPERHGYIVRYEELQKEAQHLLDGQVEEIESAGGTVASAHLRMGHPDTEIVGLAGRLGAGLIVVGSRGRGPLRRALMGSVSDSMIRHAHCPVMVVRNAEGKA
jgi:nucleotide-binding universal stress UspA family protein